MLSRPDVLVLGCSEDDVATLRAASGGSGPRFLGMGSGAELVRQVMNQPVLAVVLGVGAGSLGNLDVIAILRAARSELPVVVIAEDDSLELERRARQEGVFYYLLHPLTKREVKAVLKDLLRYPRA